VTELAAESLTVFVRHGERERTLLLERSGARVRVREWDAAESAVSPAERVVGPAELRGYFRDAERERWTVHPPLPEVRAWLDRVDAGA
jgi:hypothetical protein